MTSAPFRFLRLPRPAAAAKARPRRPLPGADLPQGSEPVELDPAEFTTEIDNEYWPMKPGHAVDVQARSTRRARTSRSSSRSRRETKEIANGVTARVVRDTVTEDGKLIEDTFDWYAQDAEGNIWYLGEDTAEFENGELTTRAGSFEAGVDGALPGIIMPADPVDGMQYRQEYYKGEAEDNGEILSDRGDGRGAGRVTTRTCS